jgi:MoxR-like ATPase
VTIEGDSSALPEPFVVVATQNPIEFEGTYPLPEAQLDRFLFKLAVGYPGRDDERAVLRMHDEGRDPHDLASLGVEPVAGTDQLAEASRQVREIQVAAEVIEYVLDLAAETRRTPSLVLGVSPRAAAMLLVAVKARAYLQGRGFVTPDDVKALVKPAWRHRVVLRPEVELEGGTADSVVEALIERVPVPR